MKNPRCRILLAISCILLAFVLGISFGRKGRGEVTVTATTRTASDSPGEITLLVNINTASLEQLTALPGIGEGYARNIIDYREEMGRFETVEELLNVEGIGISRLEAILDYITVGGTA